jgi:uncharacterized OB-fold protein
VTFVDLVVPGPTRTAVSAPFWDASAEGKFVIQRCDDCGRWVFYPRAICPRCWSRALTWTPASGQARLETWSTIHRAGHPGWQPAAPYTVCLVGLAEGPAMISLLLAPDAARLGLPLRVRFERIGETALPCFEPVP